MLSPGVRGMGLVYYYLGYMVTSLDVRGMGLVNYYLGYMVLSPDL